MQGNRTADNSSQPRSRTAKPAPPVPKIAIPHMDLLTGSGNVLALLDVRIDHHLLIRECLLLRDPHSQIYWVSPPMRPYTKNGEKRQRPLADWPKHFHAAIRSAAVACYEARQAETSRGGAS